MENPSGVPGVFQFVSWIFVLVGAASCFIGYRLSKFRIALGSITGGVLAGGIARFFSQEPWVVGLSAILGGLAGAMVSAFFYLFAVFLLGGCLGVLAAHIPHMLGLEEPSGGVMAASFIASGIGAVALSKIQRLVVIASTAFIGAGGMIFGSMVLTAIRAYGKREKAANVVMDNIFDGAAWWHLFSNEVHAHRIAMLFSWMALGVAGILVQYRFSPGRTGVIAPDGMGGV